MKISYSEEKYIFCKSKLEIQSYLTVPVVIYFQNECEKVLSL